MTARQRFDERRAVAFREFTRRAIALRYDYPETTIPLSELEAALLEAYDAGARDIYGLIDAELGPLWAAGGLEP